MVDESLCLMEKPPREAQPTAPQKLAKQEDDQNSSVEDERRPGDPPQPSKPPPAVASGPVLEVPPKKHRALPMSAHHKVPAETIDYLKAWMMSPEHIAHPFPSQDEKAQIIRDTGIDPKQLSSWFSNNRKRIWKPVMEGKFSSILGVAPAVETVSVPTVSPLPTIHHAISGIARGFSIQQQPGTEGALSGVSSGVSAKTRGPAAKKGKKKQGKRIEKKTSDKKTKRKSSGNPRLPERRPKIHIIDDDPDRLTNPLVDVPKADSDHPNAAELYVWSDIVFHHLDTYPLSYYARVLGFEVHPPVGDARVALNPATIPIQKDEGYKTIPPLGAFADVWKQQEGDEILDYQDPVYQSICQQGLRPDLFKRAALNPLSRRFLSKECLGMANEMFKDLPDFQIMDIAGDFGCCTSHHDSVSYKLAWYRLFDDQQAGEATTSHYGITSAASMLKKQKMSELVIFINCYRSGVAPSSLGKEIEPPPGEVTCIDSFQGEGVVKSIAQTSPVEEPVSQVLAGAIVTQTVTNVIMDDSKIIDMNNVVDDVGEGKFTGSMSVDMAGPVEENIDEHDDRARGQALPESTLVPEFDDEKVAEQPNHSHIPNHVGSMSEQSVIVLTALALEHARACDVWYGLVQVPKNIAAILIKYFRMVQLAEEHDLISLVCDLKKCSYKYAFLLFKTPKADECVPPPASSRERLLVRLPNVEDANSFITGFAATPRKPMTRPKRANIFFTGVGSTLQKIAFGVQINALNGALKILDKDGKIGDTLLDIPDVAQEPAWDVLKSFSMPTPAPISEIDPDDLILSLLTQAQRKLVDIEAGMESKLRSLLAKVVEERTKFEKDAGKRSFGKQVLNAYQTVLERRKEIDMAWQSQRDQDMDAVCEICNDGEVTPDNQILFCEACNVAVHQMCYGIERVPSGDYYCIACRFFEREKMGMVIAKQLERGADIKVSASPLPICCELCPRKQGAYIRCDTSNRKPENESNTMLSRWVHVLCAKWQGLNFVNDQCTDCVEDVLPLKLHFHILKVSCMLCQSDRGAFNKCREQGCENFLHVSCARSSGLCEVVHGENCTGPVDINPWTLLCPDHSGSDPNFIPTGTMTVEQLIMAAKEFPPEKLEKPKPKASQSFHKMLGKERKEAMKDRNFEDDLVEILLKKNFGVRCESCFQYEEDGKNLTRCMSCAVVFCDSCTSEADGVSSTNRTFKCRACTVVEEKKEKKEEYDIPRCRLCVQNGGWLRESFAVPMKSSIWKKKDKIKEWPKTLFAKPFWCHQLCQMWQEKVHFDEQKLVCNCNDVVMTHGRGFIYEKYMCELCGSIEGMKIQCAEPGCRGWGEMRKPYSFHATCARQAGLEVENRATADGLGYEFYAKCFRHGSNVANLRARLEDLIEIEKRRAGKKLENKDARVMSFAHASRLLNLSILVLHTLGWAWRWAEWWILYKDSWEPLLEPGQKEEDMTNEEKRIVESTQNSRCEDARKCRLAALGAALRNRSFDGVENGDTVLLDRAFRAMLHTKSLVGPLEEWEIDFFAEWLGIAYRSKSRLLGFGEDKIAVRPSRGCVLEGPDRIPKYTLGARRLPGLQELLPGQVFEIDFDDPDDFLKPERFKDGTLVTKAALNPKVLLNEQTKKRKADPNDLNVTATSKRSKSQKSAGLNENSGELVAQGQLQNSSSTSGATIEIAVPVAEGVSVKCGAGDLVLSLQPEKAPEPNSPETVSSPKLKSAGRYHSRPRKNVRIISAPSPNSDDTKRKMEEGPPSKNPTPDVSGTSLHEPTAAEQIVRKLNEAQKTSFFVLQDVPVDHEEKRESASSRN